MGNVNLTIDGVPVSGNTDMTILQAAEQAGISIPSLCRIPELAPTGACRICVVEVEGARTLVGSCHTPIAEGMNVKTRSPKVMAVRKVLIELLLAGHTGDCVNDPNADNCRLHQLASDFEVGPPRFRVKSPRLFSIEENNPYVHRDLSKCIMCRKCVEVCRGIAGKNVLSIGFRGFNSKIISGFDDALTTEECKGCLICVEHCPTGALFKPEETFQEKDVV